MRVLPFLSQPICDDPELEIPCPIALWQSADNICESGGSGRCDDSEGLYYTLAEDSVTWFCPRHWYEMHQGNDAPYRLLDMTDAEYQTASAKSKEAAWKAWERASKLVDQAANILSGIGLQEEAGRLWQTQGGIRVLVRSH